MKRFLCCFLVVTIVCCFSACHKEPASSETSTNSSASATASASSETAATTESPVIYPGPFQTYDEILAAVDNSTPYQDKLKTELEPSLLPKWESTSWSSSGSYLINIMEHQKNYPLELLRKIDDEYLYSMNKVKGGGILYSFYYIMRKEDTISIFLHSTVYLEKVLSYSAFKSLKVGSSIDDVLSIDPKTTYTIQRLETSLTTRDASMHLLKDGLLVINYDNPSVIDIKCFSDWIIPDSFNYSYHFNILPQDWPEE